MKTTKNWEITQNFENKKKIIFKEKFKNKIIKYKQKHRDISFVYKNTICLREYVLKKNIEKTQK